MLVALYPLPGEIDYGYLGRVMRINGFRSARALADGISDNYQVEKCFQGRFWFDMLSKISGLSSEEFALKHTTLPFKRGITYLVPEANHGAAGQTTITRLATYRNTAVVFFCEQCVCEDISIHGMCYWRRGHQTPGQLWCSRHICPLFGVAENDVMLFSPMKVIEKGIPIPRAIVQDALSNSYVKRYLELVDFIYGRTKPFDVAKIVSVLSEQAKHKGFRGCGFSVEQNLLSDCILEVFPYHWLERVFPSLLEKKRGEVFNQIDIAIYHASMSSSIIAYLLSIVVLFDTSDEVINKLQAAENKLIRANETYLKRKVSLPSDGVLLKIYVSEQGDYSSIFNKIGVENKLIKSKLTDLGLPDLTDKKSVGLKYALEAFFVKNLSYSDSFKISGMNSGEFDGVIRSCGKNTINALKLMGKKKMRNPKKDLANSLIRLQMQ